MEQIGVTAIIEGLSTFISGMDKIQSSIEKIKPPASILQDAFGMLGEAAGNFASFVGDVLTYTLGGLLKDAIEGVISVIVDLTQKTIDAGIEFQNLSIRLNALNLQQLTDSGVDYQAALAQSIEMTKDQIDWIQVLAIQTPFSPTTISDMYTMIRLYENNDEAARKLTQTTLDYAAGMVLTNDQAKRIIVNFRQMSQKGKVTARDLLDLANNGLAVNKVLELMPEHAQMNEKAFHDFLMTGEGVNSFMQAFTSYTEKNYAGAGIKLAQSFQYASQNLLELWENFGGANTVTPILDVLGKRLSDFVGQFSTVKDGSVAFTELGERLKKAAVGIGEALAGIVSDVLGLAPSSETLANGLVSGLQSVSTWLTDNKDTIVAKIKEIVDWFINLGNPKSDFQTNVIQPMRDLWDALFKVNEQTKTTGFQDLLAAVQNIGSAIGEVLKPVLADLGVVIDGNKPTLKDFTDALLAIGQWIRDNRETLQLLLQFFIAFVIVQTATNLIWTFIGGLIATGAAILTVLVATGALVIIIGTVIAIVMAVTVVFRLAQFQFTQFAIGIQFGITLILGYFRNMQTTIEEIVRNVRRAWENGDWAGIGWAIVSGIANGIGRNVGLVIDAARDAAWAAYQAALAALGISSPSKLFAGIGENVMAGMAQGITDSMGVAVGAMNNAVAAVTMPALTAPAVTQQYMSSAPSSISNTYQSNNSYNLSIHSQAQTEQVGSDFALMQSLAGI